MKINKAMILAAGLGTRMQPLTLKTPKPLIKIGSYNLLERSINLLIEHGIKELVINVHHLADQIENFIKKKNFKIKIIISDERTKLLNTGGGIFKGTESFNDDPFIVINPDTIWGSSYIEELKALEQLYIKTNKTTLLVVDKSLSFDTSFKGDFSVDANNKLSKNNTNKFIFTGMQILNRTIFKKTKKNIFSMNEIWDNLILEENILGLKSKNKFYHLNSKNIHEELSKNKIID
ncbi:MAG: hypothetical protein CBE47_02095 [Pelagibacteraceae bacterium TMED287]|nr:MAG: hypothetical protein CBE47_02095 [Pelagibacteraceae bacterium TMED287]